MIVKLMPRLHLAVLTTRNETWRLWKQISKFSSLTIRRYFLQVSVQYLVVKPACINAA